MLEDTDNEGYGDARFGAKTGRYLQAAPSKLHGGRCKMQWRDINAPATAAMVKAE